MLSFLGMAKLDSLPPEDPLSHGDIQLDNYDNLLTHKSGDFLTLEEISDHIKAIEQRILSNTSYSQTEKNELIDLLNELSRFELGRFLIHNKGALSGGWTHYIMMGFARRTITNELECFILTKSPSFLATRERFGIFQRLLQKNIKSQSIVCSIPCGVMSELSTLQLDPTIKEIKFVGIDSDKSVLDLALKFTEFYDRTNKIPYEFHHNNAWNLDFENQFDIIVSNGLNFYEPNDLKVISLYEKFFLALKPNGILISSSLSFPSHVDAKKSEWKLDAINMEDLNLQKKIFSEILPAKWQNFRTTAETITQLKLAGFREIEIHWDSRHIFYTFLARK